MIEHRIYSPEEIDARVAFITKVRETWKGQAAYCDLLDMEIWALSTMASLIRRSRDHVIACGISIEEQPSIAQALLDGDLAETLFRT